MELASTCLYFSLIRDLGTVARNSITETFLLRLGIYAIGTRTDAGNNVGDRKTGGSHDT